MWNRLHSDWLVLCYGLLLIVHVSELRSGVPLAILQFILGISVLFVILNPRQSSQNSFSLLVRYLPIFYIMSLFAGLFWSWFNAPNHLFLFITITILLILFKWDQKSQLLIENFRWLFILLMGAATIYKLLAPEFVNGNFTAYMFAQRKFFAPVLASGLFPEVNLQLLGNREVIFEIFNSDPLNQKEILLATDSIPILSWARQFRTIIIGGEMILTLLFILFPLRKISYISLLVFVASIGLIVPEFEFASTLLFMGLLMCPRDFRFLKKSYQYSFFLYAGLAVSYNVFQYLRHLL